MDHLISLIEFFSKNIYGIAGLIITVYLAYNLYRNYETINEYKREINNNDKKYFAKRCYEDGYNQNEKRGWQGDGRDYIYLVERGGNKKYYRIVDLYTLNRLGYPRPSRDSEHCFKISDGYSIGDEIKIYNIISDIKGIFSLSDEKHKQNKGSGP